MSDFFAILEIHTYLTTYVLYILIYLSFRYHLRIFQQLPHQMVAYLSGKQHFFIKKIFWQINVRFKSSDQKILISDFQSPFSMSKIVRIFLFSFSLKNINSVACFLLLTFKLELLKHFVYYNHVHFLIDEFRADVDLQFFFMKKCYFPPN